ncbi:MAG: 3-methyl-2-oxobutanoate hydroxymethyltransferase [Legionellales bacterium]|nr:3-methyl-2-oxobutanoate hydroxymethyltransferase [Legionellales bacterium]
MKKIRCNHLIKMKQQHEKMVMLTCYDASFAKLLNENGIEIILIGDSLGNVIQGFSSTVPVTINDMVYHVNCVARGNQHALLIADMPFMTYATPESAFKHAMPLMQAGAEMVKMEGGAFLAPTIQQLTHYGIPVCAHLGLTPQSVNVLGGYHVQGKDELQQLQLIEDAKALENAGAKLLVLECVPAELASKITAQLTIPVIGIGAGNQTDGQVLVLHDMLGISSRQFSFSKNFLAENSSIADAISAYVREVKNGQFPATHHGF